MWFLWSLLYLTHTHLILKLFEICTENRHMNFTVTRTIFYLHMPNRPLLCPDPTPAIRLKQGNTRLSFEAHLPLTQRVPVSTEAWHRIIWGFGCRNTWTSHCRVWVCKIEKYLGLPYQTEGENGVEIDFSKASTFQMQNLFYLVTSGEVTAGGSWKGRHQVISAPHWSEFHFHYPS